jgi:arsenate reductase
MKPKILFVCIENACRSQMAEGFAKFYGRDKVEVFSAGSHPSGKVDQTAIEVMKEKGIDISNQKSKGFRDLPYQSFDYVITMGCGDVCPFVPAKKRIEWEIEDPKGKSNEEFRRTRNKIENKVKEFLEELVL